MSGEPGATSPSPFQVVAGFHFKNSASKGKTVRQIETANEKKSSRISL